MTNALKHARKTGISDTLNGWLRKNWQVLALLLLCLTPLRWFKGQYVAHAPEERGYLDYSFLFEKFLYGWSSHINNGSPAAPFDHIVLYPVGVFYKLANILGIPNFATQRMFIVFIFSLTVYSVYKLCSYLVKDKTIGVICVLFYLTSMYLISTVFYTAKMLQMLLTPAFFYIIIRYLQTKSKFYLALNFIVLWLFQAIFNNMANAIITFFAYFLGVIYYYTILAGLSAVKKDIKYMVFFLLTFIPVFYNVAIIYYFSMFKRYQEFTNIWFSHVTFLQSARYLDIFDYFRGAWWDRTEYNLWLRFYDNLVIRVIALLLISFSFVGLVLKKYNKQYIKQSLFWAFAFLVFAFLVHGSSKPFGFVYQWMFANVPFFSIFREPWAKFTPMLIFCATILIAFSLIILQRHKKIIYPIVCSLIIIHGYPYFSQDYITHINTETIHSDVRFPQYYFDARHWSDEHKDDNILSIPIAYHSLYLYKWYDEFIGNHYDYGGMPEVFFYFNSIGRTAINYYEHRKLFMKYNHRLLSIFSVDYILDQTDLDVTSSASSLDSLIDYNAVSGAIEKKPVRQFGKLFIYKVNKKYLLPRIFAETK